MFIHARVAGKEEEELLALDSKTGKELWRKSYARASFRSIINTGPQATPTVAQGKVYTPSTRTKERSPGKRSTTP